MLSSSSVISPAPGFLVLRVRGSSRDGQIVRLQSSKCTIGSGSNCTLRLRADNIGAVHCLILRGPSRTVVRRWSPDTRLNGRNFTESVLQAGDCLSVGAIDLEVVETAQSGLPSENRCDQQRTIDQQLAEIEARLRLLDEQQAEYDVAQADFLARQAELDNLRAQWESRQAESRKQWDAREAEFKDRLAELQNSNTRLENERQAWEANRFQAEISHTAKAEQLAAWQEDLQRQRLAFEQQQAAGEAMKASTQQQLADRAAVLESTIADFQSRATTLEEDCRQWELIRSEQAADLDVARASLDESAPPGK